MIHKARDFPFQISTFISNWLSGKNSFECRSFYGETFSLALLYRTGVLKEATRQKLLSAYRAKDKGNAEFHWEFNNYALLDYQNYSSDYESGKLLKPLTFKNTPCTNWTLLRSNCRLQAGIDLGVAIKEAKGKIKKFQISSGLILDDPGVKSFQYHCFSMAMIAEIYEQTSEEFFCKSFLKGVEFVRHFILSSGETLYIGRGQKQSFGYGALIYILALAYRYTRDKSLLGDIFLICKFIERHQRIDGSFPLVLNGFEKTIPKVVDPKDPQFAGWYPYNNYFDYLPFMGLFLHKSFEVLDGLDTENALFRTQSSYRDDNFIKVVTDRYEAVLSRPGGYLTNDLPIPYVVADGKAILPCYGGEEFQKSLYSVKSIPLPFSQILNKSIRWRSLSFFLGNTLWVFSILGIMKRRFTFGKSEIKIKTSVFSIFNFKHQYLYLVGNEDIDNKSLIFKGYEYSASGRLMRFQSTEYNSTIILRIN